MTNIPRWFRSFFFPVVLALTAGALNSSVLAAPPPAELLSISTRAVCQTGDAVVVSEFAVQGTTSDTVLVRVIGPTLHRFGVTDAMKDPTLTLLDAAGNVLGFNDNWVDSPDRQAIRDTGIPPLDRREPAILRTLAPGIYTTVARGVRDTTGTVLSEFYDLTASHDTVEIPSMGTRASVGTGDNVMVSGIILGGSSPIAVLVRSLGPSLTAAGVSGVLADPVLTLYDGNGNEVASNDNWRSSPDKAAILASGFAPANRLESAVIATLSPGAYTAIVAGTNGGVGIAFVQYYSLADPGPELNPAPIIE